MRRSVLVVVAAIVLAGTLVPLQGAPTLQWALYQFDKPTKITDKLACGTVLFVHDFDKMAKGQPCTEVYSIGENGERKLLTAFHCRPLNRKVTEKFTVVLRDVSIAPGLKELVEYQFPGDDEGHGTPR